MAPLNIGQIGGMLRNLGGKAVQEFTDDLVAPVLRGMGTQAESALVRSAGAVKDAVVRPRSRFSQEILATPLSGSPSTFRPGLAGQKLVQQQTGRWTPLIGAPQSLNNPRYNFDGAQRFAQEFGTGNVPRMPSSLQPGPTSGSFPLNNPLNLLQAKGQYLQRQVQEGLRTGVNTSQGILRKLQSAGPTALNPLATRNPTTFLGQVGKSLNPLNPVNLGVGIATNVLLPESMRGTANIGLLTPGPIPFKVLSAGLYDTFLNPENAGVGLATGTLRDNDPMRWGYGQQLAKNLKKQSNQLQISNNPLNTLTGSATMDALNAPGVQDRFIQDKRPVPPGGGPQERARQAEIASVAQQTAQNPLFKKYQIAELTKQYNTAKNPAEKERIGLQIWAQTNPDLAGKLKSGQVGYTESRTVPGIANTTPLSIGGLPMPSTGFNLSAAMSNLGTPEQVYGTPVAGFNAAAAPMSYNPSTPQVPVTDGAIQASYGQQLLATPDFAKALRDKAFLQRAYREQGLK
jgi:hypothetical protein